jgi:peptide/nickel transport system permease protein
MVAAMLAEAGLQLIGFGAGGLPTLGFMIARGFRWGVIGAGLEGQLLLPAGVLVLLFLSLNLINLGLEEVFNPRLRTTLQEG